MLTSHTSLDFTPTGVDAPQSYLSALEAACQIAIQRRRMKLPRVRIPLHLRAEQLDNPALIETMLVVLAEHALPPTCLAVYVPEPAFPLSPARERVGKRLQALGVTIAQTAHAVS